jgi:hypothetical protein
VVDQRESDARTAPPEVAQDHRHDLGAERVQERERDAPGVRVQLLGELVEPVGEREEGPLDVGQQLPAVAGEPDGAARADEQRGAEVGLEPGDVAAEGRLGEPELICGACHMLLARDDRELPEPWRRRVGQPLMYAVSVLLHDPYIGRMS